MKGLTVKSAPCPPTHNTPLGALAKMQPPILVFCMYTCSGRTRRSRLGQAACVPALSSPAHAHRPLDSPADHRAPLHMRVCAPSRARRSRNGHSQATCLRMYPRSTPLCSVSGGGCHCTMMDWLVRPLATIFLGGALGGSSGNINLEIKDKEEREVSAR